MVCIVLMMQQRPRKITPLHMLGIGIDDEHVYVQAEKVPSAGGEIPQQLLCKLALDRVFFNGFRAMVPHARPYPR